MRYLCIDPSHPGGTPPDNLLTKTIYGGVRYSLKPNLWPFTGHCLELGVRTAWVVDADTGDLAQYVDWATADWMQPLIDIFIGNEMDGSGAASWEMSPVDHNALWQSSKVLTPKRWIGGVCSGDPAKALPYLQPDAAGLAIHIYTLDPTLAKDKVAEYATLNVPLWVGETHPTEPYKMADYEWPTDTNVNDFCWADSMVPGMGLFA